MRKTSILFIVAIVVFNLRLLAQTGPATRPMDRARIDAIITPLIDSEYCQSIIVGVVSDSGSNVFGYGRLSSDDRRAPDEKTLYEIGSVTKVFTSLLLAQMKQEGLVALEDTIDKYLPPSVKLSKELADAKVSLLELASHQSGLPRMPDNFAPANPNDPYVDYTAQRLYEFLSSCKPEKKGGGKGEYSNLGVGLLGHILGLKDGRGYDGALTQRVLKPLGMNDSSLALNDEQRKRLAPGHDADGNRVHEWNLAEAIAGAGAIRSTAPDMLKFIAAQFDGDKGPLQAAIRDTHAPRGTMGDGMDVALGWMIGKKRGFLWHNGQTGGYHSFVAVHPQRRVGVVVLSNTATDAIDAAGATIMRIMLGEDLKSFPVPLRKPIHVPANELDRYIGEFTLGPAKMVVRRGANDTLQAQLNDQPAYRIYPESTTKWYWKVVDAVAEFEMDGDGKAKKLTLRQSGRTIPMTRVSSTTSPAK